MATREERLQQIADEAFKAGLSGRPMPRQLRANSPAAKAKAAHDAAQAAKSEDADS
jgi:hypothetical protein